MSDSPVPAPRSNHAPTAAPAQRHEDGNAHLFRHAHVQRPYDRRMPYNNLVPPQAHPMFIPQLPLLFPPGPSVLLPPSAHLHTNGVPGSAAPFVNHGFSQYSVRMMPMFGQPNYQPYQHMVAPSFPPDSWIPMPNLGLPSVQNGMHNSFRGR